MTEYIHIIIISLAAALSAALPFSSSAVTAFSEHMLKTEITEDTLSLYYWTAMLCFSAVIMIGFRNIYIKTLKSVKDSKPVYKQRLVNLLSGLPFCILLFIPITKRGSAADYFDIFLAGENLLLVGAVCFISGIISLIAFWYCFKGSAREKKTLSLRSTLRMNTYNLISYVIPGTSKVNIMATNLIICNTSCKVVLREVYFYLAPQLFIISLIKLVTLISSDVYFDVVHLAISAVASVLINVFMLRVMSKLNVKWLMSACGALSLLLGAASIGAALG